MKRPEKSLSVSSRAGYAAWAQDYDSADNPMTAMVDHVIERVSGAAIDVSGKAVIELGCGTGRNARAMRRLGCARYLGIDNSPEMLAIAAASTSDEAIRFVEGDLTQALPDAAGTFDVVLVSLVFEHFEQIGGLIESAASALNEGGIVWTLEIHPQLQRGGVGAHVERDGSKLVLPSYPHTSQEFATAYSDAGLEPVCMTEWFATKALVAESAKLERYLGRPVLLETRARLADRALDGKRAARKPAAEQ